ncbi:hypothetical protein JTB14_023655 [Gonioctena quinquepunctata]|nr:hypothetical protein JTB14_023655 [Gonioctena quinquepunctata]
MKVILVYLTQEIGHVKFCSWPGLSQDIERMINKCGICERYRYATCKEPLISHEVPKLPFQRIGSDILEDGHKSYLVLIDYSTKWLEMIPLTSEQCFDVINAFKQIFATHGVSDEIVSDNMPYASHKC